MRLKYKIRTKGEYFECEEENIHGIKKQVGDVIQNTKADKIYFIVERDVNVATGEGGSE